MTEPSTRLFLFRHAQSEWNAQGRWQGRGDPPLSPSGREDATRAAERFRGFDGAVFTSPLRRATETGEIFTAALGLAPARTESGLQEWDVGEWTGFTRAEIEERFPAEFAAWRERRLARYPGGSDRTTYHEQVIEGLRRIVDGVDEPEVLAVTHAGAIGSLELHLDVHPGRGVRHLEGRWFELGNGLAVVSDRIRLLDEEGAR